MNLTTGWAWQGNYGLRVDGLGTEGKENQGGPEK